MTQGLLMYQVDAFTDVAFGGNPAAVCILHRDMEDEWMQQVAQEMNLSETAFLTPQGPEFQLRWFTPKAEVDLCGHATLAAAHILWETGYLYPGEEARFHTRSGLLTAQRLEDHIELDFPVMHVEPAPPPPGLLDALGLDALGAEPVAVAQNHSDYLLELESETVVRNVQPDFSALAQIETRGIIITSPGDATQNGPNATSAARATDSGPTDQAMTGNTADSTVDRALNNALSGQNATEYDFVSRFFAPALGVNEDPVTGSAHCALGPYWAAKFNRQTFVAYQASARGGLLHITVDEDRVRLGGRAVTVLRGEFV